MRRKGFEGLSAWVMANKAITKEARRAARKAAAVAQEELARRTRANVENLATFFSARERADAVDGWLAERQQVLLEQPRSGALSSAWRAGGRCGRCVIGGRPYVRLRGWPVRPKRLCAR